MLPSLADCSRLEEGMIFQTCMEGLMINGAPNSMFADLAAEAKLKLCTGVACPGLLTLRTLTLVARAART